MAEQSKQFELGKRHLAKMMDADPDNFTQEEVDVSEINYKQLVCHLVCQL